MDEVDTLLDSYVKESGFKVLMTSEAERFMQMSISELRKLTADECGEGAFLLSQMAAHIQERLNKELSRVDWAERKIAFIANTSSRQYGSAQFEERRMAAIRENEFTRKLYAIAGYAKQRSIRLSYLPAKLESMASKLDSLQQTKRYIRR